MYKSVYVDKHGEIIRGIKGPVMMQDPSGDPRLEGKSGTAPDRSAAQFWTAKVDLRTISTLDQMRQEMALVDWRYPA